MLPPKPRSASSVTVGSKPLWELWAESQLVVDDRGAVLRKAGGFTALDLAEKNGWTVSKAKHYLARMKLAYELSNDPFRYRNPKARFYFPPGVKIPAK